MKIIEKTYYEALFLRTVREKELTEEKAEENKCTNLLCAKGWNTVYWENDINMFDIEDWGGCHRI